MKNGVSLDTMVVLRQTTKEGSSADWRDPVLLFGMRVPAVHLAAAIGFAQLAVSQIRALKWVRTSLHLFFCLGYFFPGQFAWCLPKGWCWHWEGIGNEGGPGFTRITSVAKYALSHAALVGPEDGSQKRPELGSCFFAICLCFLFAFISSVAVVHASCSCSCSWKQHVISRHFATALTWLVGCHFFFPVQVHPFLY